jgi:DNA ligase 1
MERFVPADVRARFHRRLQANIVQPTVKKTLRERRKLLHESFRPVEGEFSFAQFVNTNDLEEIQVLLDESVKASCEGLMVKMLDTEESGYEPSKRSRNWLKVSCLSA